MKENIEIPKELKVIPNLLTRLQFMEGKQKLNQEIIDDLELFLTDKNKTYEISNKYAKLEQYIFSLKKFNDIPCELLIQTVGMREQPLLLTIILLSPREVVLLHSDSSEEIANQIKNNDIIKNQKISVKLVEISDADVDSNYNVISILVKENKGKKVIIDPTGGRKVMGIASATVAFYFRIPIVYLHGGKEVKGSIMPFSEDLKILKNPFDVYGDIELYSLLNLFNSFSFKETLQLGENISNRILNQDKELVARRIADLSKIYNYWDNFLHSNPHEQLKMSDQLHNLIIKFKESKTFNSETILFLEYNKEFLKKIETCWSGNEKNMVDQFRIIDLYQNALRRANKENYTDSIARLYRVIEMLATFVVKKEFEIEENEPFKRQILNKLDEKNLLEDLSQKQRDEFISDFSSGSKLGVEDYMKVIKYLNTEFNQLVDQYYSTSVIRETRNKSFLAHGTVPVNFAQFQKFKENVLIWISLVFKNKEYKLDYWMERSKFPKIKFN